MTHTIIVPHRNRQKHLNLFVQCYLAATANSVDSASECWSLILMDLGDEKATVPEDLSITHIHRPQPGPFRKSAAINAAVRETHAEYLTLMDVDMVFPSNFCLSVENFWRHHDRPGARGFFDVRRLDQHTTNTIHRDPEHLGVVLANPERHRNKCPTSFYGQVSGNSQITMRRDDFLTVGGMDERFVGWGFEDIEFNLRCCRYFGDAEAVQGTTLFHLFHGTRNDGEWRDPVLEADNTELFNKLRAEGFAKNESAVGE